MTHTLPIGKQLSTTSGMPVTIEKQLRAGGQGEVYIVKMGDESYALKWYHPNTATPQQLAALQPLVQMGPPSQTFLWPLDLVVVPPNRFGYLMALRPTRFAACTDYILGRVSLGRRALATVGFQLAHAFLELHSRGLCYCDINFGNVFFDPKTGDALICDNDNVGIDRQGLAGVSGTGGFMAPEIERGETAPDSLTDLHSLAVLLFNLVCISHPLMGAREFIVPCLTPEVQKDMFGFHPLFIFDPHDTSNRPVEDYHKNAVLLWPMLPRFIQKLFMQAFTKGLGDRNNGRVRESEWRGAMIRLRDAVVFCPRCNVEVFSDPTPDAASADSGLSRTQPPTCWKCKQSVPMPPLLRVGSHLITLTHDAKIYPHHVDPSRLYDFSTPVLEVCQHPQNPKRWGLRNLTQQAWRAKDQTGESVVKPGRSVDLSPHLSIHFGRSIGEVISA